MITYIVGVPGSGKTAYAVHKIKELHDKKINDTDYLYPKMFNNIGGFKHDNLERSHKWVEDNFVEFMKELHKLYDQHKKEDNLDDILIEFTKKHGYYKALIVVDEVHNTFSSKAQNSWIWLLSYHRHIFIDFIFITQSMAMIPNSKLKNMAEVFIKALQPSLRIFGSTFRYEFFENSRIAKVGKYKTDSIKMTDDVFNLYKSGDSVKQKSIIVKFIFYFVLLAVVTVGIGYVAYNKFAGKDKINEIKKETQTKTRKNDRETRAETNGTKGNDKIISNDSQDREELFSIQERFTIQNISCIDGYCSFNRFYEIPKLIINELIEQDKIRVLIYSKNLYIDNYLSYIAPDLDNLLKHYIRQDTSINNEEDDEINSNREKDRKITYDIF